VRKPTAAKKKTVADKKKTVAAKTKNDAETILLAAGDFSHFPVF